jgi:acetyl-CoA C-acetyltransferase
MNHNPTVILSAMRTPIGSFQGVLTTLPAYQLGAYAIKAALVTANVTAEQIEDVLMGCVLSAGQGQAPARQAAIHAGLPPQCGATTINKMCGSGMQAVMLANDLIQAGTCRIMIAGGMESMSNAPYLLSKAREGYRLGHHQLIDHMFLDGLEDAYDRGQLMGVFADRTAEKLSISRKQQDDYALHSLTRAKTAIAQGYFAHEVCAIRVTDKKEEVLVTADQGPGKAKPEKIPQLSPAFSKNGSVTAANASSIADGAAALVLTQESHALHHGLTPIAKIVAKSCHAQAPEWFTTAPIGAIESVLNKAQWSVHDVDLFEINEAFAVVTLAAMQKFNLPLEKVNVYGGACALGHPIGASGARILVTLINALQERELKRGVAALCIGGGEATAVAIELIGE